MHLQQQIQKYKILLYGDSQSGKTSLLLQYAEQTFIEEEEVIPTLRVEFRIKNEIVGAQNDIQVKLLIWDTAGVTRYRPLTRNMLRGTQAVIFVFNLTNRASFTNLQDWFQRVLTHQNTQEMDIVKYLVGTHADQVEKRIVQYDEAIEMAQRNGYKYFEVSSKTGENVKLVFNNVARDIYERMNSAERIDRIRKQNMPVKLWVKGHTHHTCC